MRTSFCFLSERKRNWMEWNGEGDGGGGGGGGGGGDFTWFPYLDWLSVTVVFVGAWPRK